MSDSQLVGTCQTLLVGAKRDASEIADFGWSLLRIEALAQARISFSDMPSDMELSGTMMIATVAKNKLRKQATDHCMVQIMLRVEQHFGSDSLNFKRFQAADLHSESDAGFWLVLKRIHRQASNLLATLAPQGLQQVHLETLATLTTDFNDALEAQEVAIDNRNSAVQDRIEAGNALYAEMVKLADLGKRLWLNVDESRYNEYVLYAFRGGSEPAEKQQVMETTVEPLNVVSLSVTGIDGSEQLSMDNTGPAPLVIYFSAQPTDLPPPDLPPLPPATQRTATATELGYLKHVREYLNVHNPDTGPAGALMLTVVG